ncbi:hypothetical protein [Rhizorhabdus sp. FW153]|uniref:hypothetical protein n=1 Tax=Rhizorhabdus sp. FW153 TaxID=3400216 RepID=UPI003CED9314
MRRWIPIALPILVLIAIGIYCAFPQPIRDDATLKAVASEARSLMVNHSINRGTDSVRVPKQKWPPAIASLRPDSVVVTSYMVDITIKPYFDGGWGYGFADERRGLTMDPSCWSHLAYGVYWHGPC